MRFAGAAPRRAASTSCLRGSRSSMLWNTAPGRAARPCSRRFAAPSISSAVRGSIGWRAAAGAAWPSQAEQAGDEQSLRKTMMACLLLDGARGARRSLREGGDDAGRRDLADRVVAGVGDIERCPRHRQATPRGWLKRAALPVPSTLPAEPARPASVVTTPAGVILRIVWFSESATKTLPAASTATPCGAEEPSRAARAVGAARP